MNGNVTHHYDLLLFQAVQNYHITIFAIYIWVLMKLLFPSQWSADTLIVHTKQEFLRNFLSIIPTTWHAHMHYIWKAFSSQEHTKSVFELSTWAKTLCIIRRQWTAFFLHEQTECSVSINDSDQIYDYKCYRLMT